ncbi:hypothetical protein M0R45_004037 [Rubus argutus]|uniref:DUF8204 domain-containing protein n=1 Tax=Rubus argutus TaxID=59490 RepID=A0AAW1YIG9_RUBAR
MNTRNEEEEEEEEKSVEKNIIILQVKTSKKGKSCKGTLYYSTALRSKAKNPRCIGIPRTLPHVPHSIVEASSDVERKYKDYCFVCAGFSVYLDQTGKEPAGTPLPAAAPTAAHALNKQDAHEVHQPRRPKRNHSTGTDFLTRFSRNADLVASGVWKNMGKVGNYMKESVSDIYFVPLQRATKSKMSCLVEILI